MELDVREVVQTFQEMFPKEFEISVLALRNRKLEEEVAKLRKEVEEASTSKN